MQRFMGLGEQACNIVESLQLDQPSAFPFVRDRPNAVFASKSIACSRNNVCWTHHLGRARLNCVINIYFDYSCSAQRVRQPFRILNPSKRFDLNRPRKRLARLRVATKRSLLAILAQKDRVFLLGS